MWRGRASSPGAYRRCARVPEPSPSRSCTPRPTCSRCASPAFTLLLAGVLTVQLARLAHFTGFCWTLHLCRHAGHASSQACAALLSSKLVCRYAQQPHRQQPHQQQQAQLPAGLDRYTTAQRPSVLQGSQGLLPGQHLLPGQQAVQQPTQESQAATQPKQEPQLQVSCFCSLSQGAWLHGQAQQTSTRSDAAVQACWPAWHSTHPL